jgi:multisubunit Na+/H+ antiporter MnhE subunit
VIASRTGLGATSAAAARLTVLVLESESGIHPSIVAMPTALRASTAIAAISMSGKSIERSSMVGRRGA